MVLAEPNMFDLAHARVCSRFMVPIGHGGGELYIRARKMNAALKVKVPAHPVVFRHRIKKHPTKPTLGVAFGTKVL